MTWEWLLNNWLGILSLISTVIIAFVAHGFLRKQHRVNGLLDAFKILNSREHRTSRKKVYQLNEEYKTQTHKDLKIFHKPQVEDVRADFDIIGSLIKSGNIDKEQFLIEFGPLAYRCWTCLKDSIEDERKIRKFDPFMSNFEWLADESNKYWLKKHVDLAETAIYSLEDYDNE